MDLDDLREAIRSLEEAAEREGYYSDGSDQQAEARKDRASAWERIESLLVPNDRRVRRSGATYGPRRCSRPTCSVWS